MIFDIITIFPNIFDSFLNESIIKKAIRKDLIKINVHNLRDFTEDLHQVVDDKPFGGGGGMVLKVEPIYKAVSALTKIKNPAFAKVSTSKQKSKIILFTPRGKKFNQKMATEFSKLDKLIMICGRYEGIDERVARYIADEKISIGNFVIMGGEIAALAVIEAVSRLIPGVLGKSQLLKERITKEKRFIEYPQYTRPEVFIPPGEIKETKKRGRKKTSWRVPKVLLSGHHQKIEEWRKRHSKII